MSSKFYDCIIVGSGPAGVNASVPLVQSGFKVLMLDGGIEPEKNDIKNKFSDFESIRKNSLSQHELFLGKDLSGARLNEKADQTSNRSTGKFSYVSFGISDFLPVQTNSLLFTQTLAKGGLTEIWGGACDVLTDSELREAGINPQGMHNHYQTVIDRVGVSGNLDGFITQKQAVTSTHSQKVLDKFNSKKNYFEKYGINLHPSVLSLLTEDKGERKGSSYEDNDYWLEDRKSLYKARYTLEELEKNTNFEYIPNRVVNSVKEIEDGVVVNALDFSNENHEYNGKYIILCAGALNTVRILLKSLNIYDRKVKITSKPNVIATCLDLSFLGKVEDPKRHSLCQLILENSTTGKLNSYSQIYKYKSLLLFKLLNFFPFTRPESLGFLSLFISSIFLVDSRFPSKLDTNKTCALINKNGIDVLNIDYKTSKEDLLNIKKQVKKINKSLRKLGLILLKNSYMKNGSTAHYAGGISSEDDSEAPLRADSFGKIIGTERIFAGDSSTWKSLSAKPPTLTIMANANRIGEKLVQILKSN